MTYADIERNARANIGPHCKVCKACDGQACKGVIPGPGGKGTGIGFIRNYRDFKEIALNMDTLHDVHQVDTSCEFFGLEFSLPVFVAPVGAVQLHYGPSYDDLTYSEAVIKGCAQEGSIAFTGDGVVDAVYEGTATAIKAQGGRGIPTIKPWAFDAVVKKIRMAEEAGAPAVAMDIDAAGLTILAAQGKPVAPVSKEMLTAIVQSTKLPFIVKGIMTTEAALRAKEAGAYAIVVSNHGGRVLDETPSSISRLAEIRGAVGADCTVLIDGGVRSGLDVFKAIALGANGVLVARPFVTAVYGGGSEGVSLLIKRFKDELESAMLMTGCKDLSSIKSRHVLV